MTVSIKPGTGQFTVTTKHHRTRRVSIAGDRVLVAGQPTSYVVKAVAEASRVARLLADAMAKFVATNLATSLAGQVATGWLCGRCWPSSVPGCWGLAAVYEVARRCSTWARP